PSVSTGRAQVSAALRVMEWGGSRELTVRHTILDASNQAVSEVSESIRTCEGRTVASRLAFAPVDNPQLWSVDRPYLYFVRTELLEGDSVIDFETNRLGFRWFEFDPHEGFSLNGQSMKLCGVNCHQDFPGLGPACPERFHRRDIEIMKAAGINFLRTSHYPRNERALDYCDELGILVMEEQPFWHGSLRSFHGEGLIDYGRRMMRDMVEHHGNHPSIIAWNTVNEVMLTPDDPDYHAPPEEKWKRRRLNENECPFARRGLSTLYDELKRCDPSRPVSMIIGGSHKENESAGMTRLADMVGYNGGAFHAELDGRPLYDIHKEQDPERIAFMSEGILNKNPAVRADWEKELVFWETPALHWSRIYERPWFCGGAMWVFADYSAKGVYRIRGMVDYSRLPYESYYFFQSQWTDALMAHICCHWDWDVAEGTERRVVVFTNGEEAELFLNGDSCGIAQANRKAWPHLPHPPVEWTVPYRPGKLEVVVRRGDGQVRDERQTSGAPAGLWLETENGELRADGQDVAFITATIVDAEGRRCYTAPETELRVSVEGPADAAVPPQFTARGGVARFAVRGEAISGEIRVQVSGGGLAPSAITVRSVE
ncbi:MAG: glycoside hydrolase family 2 protein, partial [Candidatus Sumerlaeota bacterium]